METNADEQDVRRSASKSWGDERDWDVVDLSEGNVDLLERLSGIRHTVPRSRLKKAMKILSATRTLEPLHPTACECGLKCYTGVQVADVVAHRVTMLNVMPPQKRAVLYILSSPCMCRWQGLTMSVLTCGKGRRSAVKFSQW